MKQKLLLINPPYPFEENPSPPFGLMSLAGYMLEKGFDVSIEDYVVNTYSAERLRNAISRFKPDLVGSTAVTMNVNGSLKILKDCKDAFPDIKTVIGGPHVTFDAENILAMNPFVDYVVRGEGEITLLELMESKGNGTIDTIAGLSHRNSSGVVHNPRREFVPDINIFPYPARNMVQLGKYRGIGLPINMVTSRGCPYDCIFCVGSKMVGKKIRYFDIDRVVKEFEMLSKMGFIQINISDDLFTSNKKRCIAICREIMKRGIKHPWGAFARVDTVNEELLSVMKEAGCKTLCFGMESGNQEILNTIKKKTNIETSRKAAAMCIQAGIQPMTSYILGLPGETPDTVRETLSFAASLSPLYGFHILAPFPGTEIRDRSSFYGLRIFSDDWDKYDANQSVSETAYISGSEIDRIVNEFNNRILSYISTATKMYDCNEPLAAGEIDMVESIKSGLFTRDIIFRGLIESYPGMNTESDDELIRDIARHIQGNSEFKEEYAGREITRLVDTRCLRISENGSGRILEWV